jgi:hypothetical protein
MRDRIMDVAFEIVQRCVTPHAVGILLKSAMKTETTGWAGIWTLVEKIQNTTTWAIVARQNCLIYDILLLKMALLQTKYEFILNVWYLNRSTKGLVFQN